MSFHSHAPKVHAFYQKLTTISDKSALENHLHDLLKHVYTHGDSFESTVHRHSPFYAEFFEKICAESIDPEICFALLECLIIFCRERQLRQENPSAEEKALLHFFEHSVHWQDQEDTLLGQWYWEKLPQIYS